MRIKIIKNYKSFATGQTLMVDKAHGELLIKKGVAIKTKDMNGTDIHG